MSLDHRSPPLRANHTGHAHSHNQDLLSPTVRPPHHPPSNIKITPLPQRIHPRPPAPHLHNHRNQLPPQHNHHAPTNPRPRAPKPQHLALPAPNLPGPARTRRSALLPPLPHHPAAAVMARSPGPITHWYTTNGRGLPARDLRSRGRDHALCHHEYGDDWVYTWKQHCCGYDYV